MDIAESSLLTQDGQCKTMTCCGELRVYRGWGPAAFQLGSTPEKYTS